MTAPPLTPNDVALALARLGRDLEACVRSLDHADRESVHKREDFTLALSRAFLATEGPMDMRKHRSIVDTHTERLAAEVAEQIVWGLRRQVDSIKVRIDIGRSVGTALRAELTALGGTS
ncbi:hypothetical protein [Nocardioides sp.]|uniref:hypothetical protein n=1 Tax=Nocardioides sp. TaxID=35761 RepID=UPI002BBB252E|nr:hypothetical protein [Nocardioides sp.]HXH77151.1 hypothetical protein [Nocardioides sp.]